MFLRRIEKRVRKNSKLTSPRLRVMFLLLNTYTAPQAPHTCYIHAKCEFGFEPRDAIDISFISSGGESNHTIMITAVMLMRPLLPLLVSSKVYHQRCAQL